MDFRLCQRVVNIFSPSGDILIHFKLWLKSYIHSRQLGIATLPELERWWAIVLRYRVGIANSIFRNIFINSDL
jgi:hypothetical protein